MSQTRLCIHGHFYQPPRENPWLDVIETQPSAKPFHDWNQRVSHECYRPNGRARVLDQQGRITRLVNNYEYMSFNFGPTLLRWMERHAKAAYRAVLEGDANSRARQLGRGNALAQVYNHIIMPLADDRDKRTQIRWGKADFIHRFGRSPEGMWLAETAVDARTLALMAEEGIRFTILAPHQAARVRPMTPDADEPWMDVDGGRIDPRRAYRFFLDPAKTRYIDLFFYDGPVSQAVAFERLLADGGQFLTRLKGAGGRAAEWPRLVNIATDGESYGHHFQFGEMALAWVFDQCATSGGLTPTNYAAYLAAHPSEWEVRIVENSAWSCAHGVERWRSDCGCSLANRPGWNQKWRTPLREGLNWLRDRLAEVFEEQLRDLLVDPWAARDAYIQVILDPGEKSRAAFLADQARRPLTPAETIKVFRLLTAQEMGLYMFTSCGWFFDDIAGIEAVQNLKYAARAVDLAGPFAKTDLTAGLLEYLAKAESNQPKYKNGAFIYETEALKSRIGPTEVAAHYALRALIEEGPLAECPVAGLARPIRQRRLYGPGLVVVLGEIKVQAPEYGQEEDLAYAAWHQGGLAMSCLARPAQRSFDLDSAAKAVSSAVDQASIPGIREAFEAHLPGAEEFGLDDLLPDSRYALARNLARDLHQRFQAWINDFFANHQDLLLILEEAQAPDARISGFVYTRVIGDRLSGLLDKTSLTHLDWDQLEALAEKAEAWEVTLNDPLVSRRTEELFMEGLQALAAGPHPENADRLLRFLRLADRLRLAPGLRDAQDTYYDLVNDPGFTKTLTPETRRLVDQIGWELGFDLSGE